MSAFYLLENYFTLEIIDIFSGSLCHISQSVRKKEDWRSLHKYLWIHVVYLDNPFLNI